AVVALLVVSVIVVVDHSLRTRIAEQTTDQLAREARLVSVEWRPGVEPDALADEAGRALGHRVTLIAPSGKVIGDSQFDSAGMARLENHSNRPEVMSARTTGRGSARRLSASAGDQELYVAVRAPLGGGRVSV